MNQNFKLTQNEEIQNVLFERSEEVKRIVALSVEKALHENPRKFTKDELEEAFNFLLDNMEEFMDEVE